MEDSDKTLVREGVACTLPSFWLADMERGNALGGPIKEVRRPLTGEGEVRSALFVTGAGSLWLDCEVALDNDVLDRFAAAGVGTCVAFGKRRTLVAETVLEVVSVVEVGEHDGFTVVHPLRLLALDIARGFATPSEERVDVEREIEYRDRAEVSECTGMDVAGQQQGELEGIWKMVSVAVSNGGERTLHCIPTLAFTPNSNNLFDFDVPTWPSCSCLAPVP